MGQVCRKESSEVLRLVQVPAVSLSQTRLSDIG